MRAILLTLAFAGCGKDEADKETGDQLSTDTDAVTSSTGITAAGDWVGTCHYSGGTQSLDYAIELALAETDAGSVTGTMDLTITSAGYTGTGYSYVFDVQGTRTGADVELDLTPGESSSSGVTGGTVTFTGTITGDDMSADLNAVVTSYSSSSTSGSYSGTFDIPCDLSR